MSNETLSEAGWDEFMGSMQSSVINLQEEFEHTLINLGTFCDGTCYQELANHLGLNVNQLTREEKQMAFLSAILRESHE